MSDQSFSSVKGTFQATASSNKQFGPRFYKLKLEFSAEGAKAFADFNPGQFAELDLSHTALPPDESIPEDLRDAAERKILLRRPFSFTNVTAQKNKTIAELLYCVVGPATLRMTTISPGDSLSVIGPLGNGFSVPDGKKTALLVVGGMGVPPLLHLAKHITSGSQNPKLDIIAFAGAKTATELPFENCLDDISQQLGFSLPEFAKYGVESLVATDDGSAGYHGFVTDCLADWLSKSPLPSEDIIIYSCGPESMLANMVKLAKEKNIDCQLSLERRMACGIGLCQSCAVECRVTGSNETVYKMCCKDGPVFKSNEVVF
ncbi:MAG: dihydroorotate dehydrogenase electron transfer subunit [Planctomycetota bacterium]|jgi:dihydroorotate dehydrogenase electron transfer subunit